MRKKNNRYSISKSNINSGGNFQIGDYTCYDSQKSQNSKINSFDLPIDWSLVREQIAKGRINQVLQKLLSAAEIKDKDLYEEVIIQSERWEKLQIEKKLDKIIPEKEEIKRNRIIRALLYIVDELEAI